MNRIMKYMMLTGLSVVLSSAAGYAAEPAAKTPAPQAAVHPVQAKPAEKTAVNTVVTLYESPEFTSKVVGHFPVTSNFVGIFRQGEWVKVGDRENGQTGWINLKAYHAAQQAFYHDYFHINTETIYVHPGKGKDTKPVVEVYRNGKKLPDSEAQQYYNQMKKQQEQQWQAMQRFNAAVNHQVDSMLASPSMLMPGVVIVDQPAAAKANETSGNTGASQK